MACISKEQQKQPLKDILASDKVGIILGARQVGKTTLVEHVLAGQGRSSSISMLRWTRRVSGPLPLWRLAMPCAPSATRRCW